MSNLFSSQELRIRCPGCGCRNMPHEPANSFQKAETTLRPFPRTNCHPPSCQSPLRSLCLLLRICSNGRRGRIEEKAEPSTRPSHPSESMYSSFPTWLNTSSPKVQEPSSRDWPRQARGIRDLFSSSTAVKLQMVLNGPYSPFREAPDGSERTIFAIPREGIVEAFAVKWMFSEWGSAELEGKG